MNHAALGLLLASTLLAIPARADTLPPLTPEQQTSLGRALRMWSGGLVAGDVGDAPGFTATPADGHYDVSIPVAGPIGRAEITGVPITAKATPRDGGVQNLAGWVLDDVTLPSPLRLTLPPGKDGKRVTIEQSYADQVANVAIDPDLKSPTSADTLHDGWTLRLDDGSAPMQWSAKSTNAHVEWAPSSAGRVDTGVVTRIEELALKVSDHSRTSATIRTATSTLQTADVDPDATSRLVRRVIAFVAALPAGTGDDGPKLTEVQRGTLKQLIHDARDLSRAAKQAITADGVSVTSDGRTVAIDQVAMTQAVEVPDGKLDLHQRFEVSGLKVGGLPPGPLADLVPHHVVLAPHLSGIRADDVAEAIDRAIDSPEGKDDAMEQLQAAVAKSPVTGGLDELSFDAGPATLVAKGSVTASTPADVDGAARIEVTGLDALIKLAKAQPTLKQGLPVLIYLKGIGNQEGAKTVWEIGYKAGAFTVNGTDMSSLIPGAQ